MQLKYSWAIICEGPADESFFKRLINELNLPNFDILPGKGRGHFAEMLKGLRAGAKASKLDAILIVSDNDDDPSRSFGEVKNQIRIAGGYPIPEEPMRLAKTTGQPAVLIMMIPWIDIPGCLESLMKQVWQREQEATMLCVEEFLKCSKVVEWEIQKRDKAAVQCFIAGFNREDPNKSLRFLLDGHNDLLPMNALEFAKIAATLRDFGSIVA